MALLPLIREGDWKGVNKNFQRISSDKLGPISSPTFADLILSDLTASRLVATGASKQLISSDLVNWVTGTANQVIVTDDSDGTITLSTPQDIHTTASPSFQNLNLSGDISAGGSANSLIGTIRLGQGKIWEDENDISFESAALHGIASLISSGAITGNSFITGGNIGVSGDTDLLQLAANSLTVNGAITATDDITTPGDVIVGTGFAHQGDTDTYCSFIPDAIAFTAGGLVMFRCTNSGKAQDTVQINDGESDVDFVVAGNANTTLLRTDAANNNISINAVALSANYDLALLGDGVLCLKETATPTADTNYGKVYCKNDNKLYFQDGAGNEHEIAFV